MDAWIPKQWNLLGFDSFGYLGIQKQVIQLYTGEQYGSLHWRLEIGSLISLSLKICLLEESIKFKCLKCIKTYQKKVSQMYQSSAANLLKALIMEGYVCIYVQVVLPDTRG